MHMNPYRKLLLNPVLLSSRELANMFSRERGAGDG